MYNVDNVISLGDLNLIYYILKNLVKGIDEFDLSNTVSYCESGTYNVSGSFNLVDDKLQPTTDINISIDNPFKWCTYIITVNAYEQGYTDSLEHKRELKYYITQKDDETIDTTIHLYDLNPNELIDSNATVEILFNVNEQTEAMTITLTANKTVLIEGESLILTGRLSQNSIPISNAEVQIFKDNTAIDTVTTDANGNFSKTVTGLDIGSYMFKAGHNNVISPNIDVSVRYVYEVDTDNVICTYYDGTDFVATVTDYQGNPYGIGETVSFVINGTTYNRVIDSNGEAKLSITFDSGTYSVQSSYADITNTNTITVQKASSTVSMSASDTNIGKDESVTISGTVSGAGSITGSSVKLYDGTTLYDTLTITNGEYSTTITDLSVGTHNFKVIYEGDSNHNSSESSVIPITVNDVVYTLTLAVDPVTVAVGDPVTCTGQFTRNGQGVANARLVIIIVGGEMIAYPVTDENGEYVANNIIFENQGTYTLVAGQVERQIISNMVTITVTESHDYALSVQSTKDILSYADHETATITGTLTDDGVAVAGETLSYTVKHGTTTITTGSGTTDSNGQVSITYQSTGVGDVTVEFDYGVLLQETFVIEDCVRYDSASTDKTTDYSYSSTVTSFTHSVDHYEAVKSVTVQSGANYYSPVYIDETLPTNFEISVDLNISGISNYIQTGLCVSDAHITTYQGVNECSVLKNSNTCGLFYRVSGSLTNYSENTNLARDTWYKYSLKVEGTSVTAKIIRISDNTVMYNQTKTLSNIQSWKKWNLLLGYDKQTLSFKNLKIKAL